MVAPHSRRRHTRSVRRNSPVEFSVNGRNDRLLTQWRTAGRHTRRNSTVCFTAVHRPPPSRYCGCRTSSRPGARATPAPSSRRRSVRHCSGVGLDLMTAVPAPHNEAHTRRGGIAERHRRTAVGLHPSASTRRPIEQVAAPLLLGVIAVLDLVPFDARVIRIGEALRDDALEVVATHQIEELAASALD